MVENSVMDRGNNGSISVDGQIISANIPETDRQSVTKRCNDLEPRQWSDKKNVYTQMNRGNYEKNY